MSGVESVLQHDDSGQLYLDFEAQEGSGCINLRLQQVLDRHKLLILFLHFCLANPRELELLLYDRVDGREHLHDICLENAHVIVEVQFLIDHILSYFLEFIQLLRVQVEVLRLLGCLVVHVLEDAFELAGGEGVQVAVYEVEALELLSIPG